MTKSCTELILSLKLINEQYQINISKKPRQTLEHLCKPTVCATKVLLEHGWVFHVLLRHTNHVRPGQYNTLYTVRTALYQRSTAYHICIISSRIHTKYYTTSCPYVITFVNFVYTISPTFTGNCLPTISNQCWVLSKYLLSRTT